MFVCKDTIHNWSYVFYISAGVNVATSAIYILFCTAQEQPWGRANEEQEDNKNEAAEN